MKIDKMVVLTEYDSVLEAEMAKSLLDNIGIWSMINNEYMSTIYPTGVMPAQLIVMEEDLARAKSEVARLNQEESEASEEPVEA